MKKNILALGIILVFSYLLSGCGSTPQLSPTIEPTQLSTKTNTPEPTSTKTPSPTLTPTAISTLAFYSVDPTIVATAESCSALPSTICVSALHITLSGKKLDKYEVAMSYPGFSGTSFECPQQALLVSFGENMAPVICNSDEITFISVGLTEITITINWDSGSVTQTLHPNFEVSAPQGKDCKPQCSIGKAEINIP
ncbi:MAG: hypothetical protein JNK81_16250 [Anaerolineales bacterium]|nr:hypothetical protein [Anaerolineales bacterium]